MPRTVDRLQILLEAKNQASGPIRNVQSELGGLGQAAGKLLPAASAVGAAMAAWKLGQLAFDLGRASAATLRLSDSFDTLTQQADTSADVMLGAMRQASQGMISDADLITAANRAMLLQVADSADEMAKLLQVAQVRGRAMGMTTQQAFNDLVTGLGRASPMILDNLGITLSATDAYARYAKQLGVAADELTKQQQIQALTNEVIAQSSDLLEDNAAQGRDMAGSFERMDASLANAKQALGALFTPAAAKIAEGLATAADHVAEAARNIKEQGDLAPYREGVHQAAAETQTLQGELHGLSVIMQQLQDETLGTNQVMLGAWGQEMPQAIMGNRQAMIAWVQAAMAAREEALGLAQSNEQAAKFLLYAASGAAQASGDMGDLAWSMNEVAGSADTARASTAGLADQIQMLVGRLRDIQSVSDAAGASLRSSFLGAVADLGPTGALAGYQEANAQLQTQVKIWQTLGYSAEEIEFKTAAFVDQIRTANSELGKTTVAAQSVDQEFQNLVSSAQSIISQSLSVDVGVDPADFLPRPDAINENARRLADIMANGLRPTEWMDEFKREVPGVFEELANSDDPRQAAARMLQAFQMGLRPELLDREQIKDRVKQMLIGGQNVAEMAQGIAQELSQELGVSLQAAQQQVSAVLGTGAGGDTGTGPGSVFGAGFVSGVADEDFGAQAVKALAQQLDNQESTIRSAGSRHGQWYGENFVEVFGGSVPPQIVGTLARLVTPEVLAMIQAQNSQAGTVD